MKNFIAKAMAWKSLACFIFTGVTFIYLLTSFLLGNRTIGIATLFSLLIVSAIGALLYSIAFSEGILKKAPYALRIIVFAIPFSALLFASSFIFSWFSSEISGARVLLPTILVLAFIGITIGLEIYYKATGKKYDGLLGQYKKSKELK